MYVLHGEKKRVFSVVMFAMKPKKETKGEREGIIVAKSIETILFTYLISTEYFRNVYATHNFN